MNEASRHEGGPPTPLQRVADLRDVLGRIVAAREELVYEPSQAAVILAGLEDDLAPFLAA